MLAQPGCDVDLQEGCGGLPSKPLASSDPQVAARACLALGTALQLCRQCGAAASESFSQAQLSAMATQLVGALQRHAAEPAVQAAGMHALLRLAGCAACRQLTSREQQDALGAAGAIPAALAALAALRAAAESGDASTSDGDAADGGAAAAGTATQQQQRVAGISAGLQALHYVCVGHTANLEQLAGAGGMQAVDAALAAARSEWPAEEHALLLLAALACREGAPTEEQAAAAATIWAAAQAQVERRLVEVGRAAVWGMARLLQRLQAGAGASPQTALAVSELQLQGAAVALAMLQSCDKQDDPLIKHCLDFLSVVATAPRADGGQPLPPGVAAALLSREAAAAVLVVGGKAGEPRTQATALRTLYCICRAGSCGLTWQQLAAGGAPDEAQLVAGAPSVAAAVFAVATSTSQAAAAGGSRDGSSTAASSGSTSPDLLAVQLYGLAAVGALLEAVEARSPAAAAALAQALHGEQLAAAQEAVAAACAALGRSPHLLALLDAQQVAGDGADATAFSLDLGPDASCHARSWAEPPAWQPAADAVRGVCRLLRCAPEGANAADREGFTLLHRLALAGLARCLQLLLSEGGESLDLLARTRGGATALQLAVQQRHEACVQLLEAATQAAAEARQAALLAELEEMDEDDSASGSKKSKKKKSVTRSASFVSEQPDEKAARMGSSGGGSPADDDGLGAATDAAAAAAEAAQQRALEERLRVQQEREDAYEQALEERRQELAALQAAAAAMPPAEQSLPGGSDGASSAEGRQPGTPDADDIAASSTAATTPAGLPAEQNLLATAAAAAAAPAAAAASGDAHSQQSAEPAALQGLLAGLAGLAGLGPLGLQQQQQAQQEAQQQEAQEAQQGLGGLGGPLAIPQPAADGLGSAGSSLFGSAAGGSSLFGSPTMSTGLGARSDSFPSSMAGSMAGSPFPQASLASGLPGAAQGHPYAPRASAFAANPPSCAAPFPSPASSGSLGRQGLPPLPGGRQASLSAALAAAAAAGQGGAGAGARATSPLPAARVGSPSFATAMDTDQLLSMRLQDALFVGSPAAARQASPQAAAAQRASASLFASLAGHNGGGAGVRGDDDADSLHLLSNSLSCLDDGGGEGRGLLARSISGLSTSSMLTESVSGSLAAAAAAMRGDTPGLHSERFGSPRGDASSDGSGSSCAQRVPDAGGSNSDESSEPTRHLWIGNLGTRTPRAVLKSLFERYGTVDDVVTFPGRMYAFVNYRTTEEAVLATATLQDTQVADLTGDRRLLIKYRPAKKAAVHLRALGLVDDEGLPTDDRLELDRDGNCTDPSPRIWLGNIAPTATSKSLHAVLGRFGALTDAAVFPARIGPLGYAFVKFERLEDAVRAFETLNNTVVPPLSGSKQLKMRYKPANDGPAGRGEDPSDPAKALMVPSRHLWLGNITQKPTDDQVLDVFASFGKVDSVRVFPVKAYAFVNYSDIGSAIKAMQAVDGLAIPQLTGVKPLVMRYQQESGGSSASSTPKPPSAASTSLLPRAASEAALAALGLNQLVPGSSLASLLTGGHPMGGAAPHAVPASAPATSADGSSDDDGLMPVPNLSNKLNPNNIHYDAELAERYRHMNRREKDLMWAADSLLHPADPAKGMLRSHSMGYLGGHAAQPSSTAAAAAAATAQAHGAIAVLLQQQQQQGGLGVAEQAQLAQLQRLVTQAAAGVAGGGGGASQLTSQLLALQQLAPSAAPPAHHFQLPSGASATQLTAVLNNLTAMRRTGSAPMPGSGLGSNAGGLHSGLGMSPAPSLPLPGGQQSGDLMQQLQLLQQQQQGGGPGLDGYASQQLQQQLSGMLSQQPSGHMMSPQHSGHSSLQGLPTSMLSPQLSLGGAHGHAPSQAAQHPDMAASLAAALGQLAATSQPAVTPPSPPQLVHHSLSPQHHQQAQAGGSLPQHFICPLSRQVMTDPVIAADGQTYDRQSITEWFSFKDVSPVTQMPLPHKMLTPNSVLRQSLLGLLGQHC